MRILLISHSFPLPPHDGGRIAFFNSVKYLAKSHEEGVGCLAETGDQDVATAELEKYCSYVRIFKRSPRADSFRVLRGVVSDPPGAALKYWCPAAGALIRN